MNSPTFNILTFDGGGVRGVYSARLLQRLADAVPELLHETMLLAGTSTGGIIACGLGKGLSPAALVELYRQHASTIFDKRFLGGLIGAKYGAGGLREVLEGTFGATTLGELQRFVLIPSLDLDSPATEHRPRSAKAKFFESKDDADARVVDVLLATTAAPTFFPSSDGYVDGGLVANSPSLHAAAQAITYGVDPASMRVLSVGTGQSPAFIEGEELNWGALRWAPKIPSLMIGGVSGVSDYICRRVLGGRYHRLDGALPRPVELDDVREIEPLLEMADAVDVAPCVEWLKASGWTGSMSHAS